MDPSKAHYTLSHGQVAHVDKSERDINVTVATSRVPSEMTVQGQRCAGVLNYRKSHCCIKENGETKFTPSILVAEKYKLLRNCCLILVAACLVDKFGSVAVLKFS